MKSLQDLTVKDCCTLVGRVYPECPGYAFALHKRKVNGFVLFYANGIEALQNLGITNVTHCHALALALVGWRETGVSEDLLACAQPQIMALTHAQLEQLIKVTSSSSSSLTKSCSSDASEKRVKKRVKKAVEQESKISIKKEGKPIPCNFEGAILDLKSLGKELLGIKFITENAKKYPATTGEEGVKELIRLINTASDEIREKALHALTIVNFHKEGGRRKGGFTGYTIKHGGLSSAIQILKTGCGKGVKSYAFMQSALRLLGDAAALEPVKDDVLEEGAVEAIVESFSSWGDFHPKFPKLDTFAFVINQFVNDSNYSQFPKLRAFVPLLCAILSGESEAVKYACSAISKMLYEVTPKPIAPHLNQIVPALFEALKTQRAKSARCAVLRCLIDLVACVDHLHLVEVHRRMWEVEYAGEEREINELAHQLFLDVQQRLYGALHGEVNADFHSAAQSVIRQVIHSDGELLQDLGCNPEVLIFSQLLQLTSRLTSKRRGDKDGDGRGPLLKDHLLPAMLHFVRHTADLGAVRVAHRRLGFDEDQCLQDVWVLSRLQNEIGKKARLVLEAVREREEKEKE